MVNTYDFHDCMLNNNILFSFQGEITSELVSSILLIMEMNLESSREEVKVKKKIYYVLVECLQNLYHHMEDSKMEDEEYEKLRVALFMIGRNENNHTIMTGNLIKNENVKMLEERLTEINSFSKTELKEKYISILSNGEMSAKGGGGLGLLDITRKTGEKYVFNFKPVDEKYSFFELGINIPNN